MLSQPAALVLSTAVSVVILSSIYGVVFNMHPRSVVWHRWINASIPIVGDVEVSGSVDVGNEPLKVEIER
jgi:hypothetical protein